MDITLPAAKRPKSRQSIATLPRSDDLKENATDVISSSQRSRSNGSQVEKKKTRGKSLGPGGLEALKETTGNATQISLFTPRSILKPTIPLTPPKAIPSFDELRKRSTGKGKSPAKGAIEDLLIDFSTPGPSKAASRVSVSELGASQDPFSPVTRKSPRGQTVALRTEDEQQDAAREREAEEHRKVQKEAALAQRAARRKSMANRRVSFAPEATLHTWNVIELAEDSTTSSASNSTRRQSSMTAAQSPHPPQSPAGQKEQLETAPEHLEDSTAQGLPGNQKKRRRRSSTAPPKTQVEKSPESLFSSSPTHGSSVVSEESSPGQIEDSIHSSSDDDDTEVDDGTAMSMDEATSQTAGSNQSGSSTTSLDERLRLAAGLAGTRGIEYDEAYDENGDHEPMEMVTGTNITAFQPFAAKQPCEIEQNLSAIQDRQKINPFATTSKANAINAIGEAEIDEDQDMTMDMTHAVGGIVRGLGSPSKVRRRSAAGNRRRSSVARRRSTAEESEGETMDLTTVGGGILQQEQNDTQSTRMSDEDLSMDFTNVIGGVLAKNGISRRDSTQSIMIDENETMDMTAAIGGILPAIEERTEPMTEDDRTMTMDMTRAVGSILPASLSTKNKTLAKQLMEEEASVGQLTGSPQEEAARRASTTPSNIVISIATGTGSPSIALKPRTSSRKSLDAKPPEGTTPRHVTPTKASMSKQATPTKQVTPMPVQSEKPNRSTPLSVNVTHRGASPKKLFKAEMRARASPANANPTTSAKKASLFDHNEHTGHVTPSVVLHAPKPHQHLRRRSSGIGIDQEGLGSPSVTKLLDRRTSISESVPAFNFTAPPPSSRFRFEDPKVMEEEIDAERAEEHRRESGRFVMEQEADDAKDENATLQLKEMILALSPKKNKLKGRKSLAPGGARGILGKRPAELDMDDDDERETTPKRLKMVERDASPVKSIKLAQPPSAEETTGRLTRSERRGLHELAANITPTSNTSPKSSIAKTPQHGRFKEAPTSGVRPSSFEDNLDNVMDAVDVTTARIDHDENDEKDDERISLQSFLNMTNIHFIELSTTKRRHTMAPQPSRPSQETEHQQSSLEACLSAATTTLPLLELYQHATRELKQYISTGRKIIRSIEAETLKEQPQLFREYVDARPDVKVVMDNQFRNGKTNARLQSKAGWYAWRRQLVDGLRDGLEGIKCGMEEDAAQLAEQEAVLGNTVPELVVQHAELEQQLQKLKQRVEEYDGMDHEALSHSRAHLQSADEDLASKSAQLEQLQQQTQDKIETLAAGSELKDEMLEQIAEAERVHEECLGWSGKDVSELKSKVEKIEQKSGWKLLSAEEDEESDSGVAITMSYKEELKLFFHPAAFVAKSGRRRSGRTSRSVSGPNAPISLTYSPKDEGTIVELSTERRFFLQMMRSQLHTFAMMPRGSVSAKAVLLMVSQGWQMASQVSEEVRLLNMAGITDVGILGDEQLGATLVFLLNGSRININFALHASIDAEGDFVSRSSVSTKAIYGSVAELLSVPGKSRKVQTALSKEVESRELGAGAWVNAVKGLESWIGNQLQARKDAPPPAKPVPAQTATAPAQTATAPAHTATAPAHAQPASRPAPKSPLAPKSVNRVQKRSIPVPQQREKLTSMRLQSQSQTPKAAMATEENKENVTPVKQMGTGIGMEGVMSEVKGNGWEAHAAIPPELQEEMMRTPIKRVGALRRSPLLG